LQYLIKNSLPSHLTHNDHHNVLLLKTIVIAYYKNFENFFGENDTLY